MRKKRKFIIKLLFFSIIFMLFSCSEEFYENSINQNNNKKYSINKTTFKKIKDYKMKSFVLQSQNKILTNKVFKSTNRSIEDFVIDTTNVMEISDGITKSYTFSIVNTETTKIENLVAIEQNEEFKSYLVEYNLTSEEVNMIYANNITTNITPDYITNLDTESKISPAGPCVLHSYESVLLCYDANGNTIITSADSGDGCEGLPFDGVIEIYDINLNCNSSGGGGSSGTGEINTSGGTPTTGSSEGGGSTTYSSNNSNTDSNVLTTPVNPIKIFNQVKTPCQQLKDNNTKSIANTTPSKTVLSNLIDLSTQMVTNPRERMYVMTPLTATENQFIDTPPIEGPLNGGDIAYDFGTNAVSIMMHCHYNTTLLPIFSLSDIEQIYFSTQMGNIFSPNTFTSYLVTAHGTKYAIKFTAPPFDTNSPYNQFFFTGWEIDAFRNMQEKKYEQHVKQSNSIAQNELGFLKFIKEQNLGLEIYKATDNNFSQWTKLTLDSNNQVKPVPCP